MKDRRNIDEKIKDYNVRIKLGIRYASANIHKIINIGKVSKMT